MKYLKILFITLLAYTGLQFVFFVQSIIERIA